MAYDLIPQGFFSPRFLDNWDVDLVPFSTGNGLSISEDEENIYVEASLPGIDPSQVEITFDKGTLWIKGEMEEKEEDKKKKFYRRASSSYSYRVSVPGEIDQNKEPEATYNNGVMKVSFAKSAETKPKKIKVKIK